MRALRSLEEYMHKKHALISKAFTVAEHHAMTRPWSCRLRVSEMRDKPYHDQLTITSYREVVPTE